MALMMVMMVLLGGHDGVAGRVGCKEPSYVLCVRSYADQHITSTPHIQSGGVGIPHLSHH